MSEYPWDQRSYACILREKAATSGDRVFLRYRDSTFTYGGFNDRVARVAAGFQELGIARGENVALLLPNCPEFLEAWWALTWVGAVEVPVNAALFGELLAYAIDYSDASTLIIHEQHVPGVAAIAAQLPKVRRLIVVGEGGHYQPADWEVVKYGSLYSCAPEGQPTSMRASELVSIMFTSGTTGRPKGIMRAYNHDYTMAQHIIDALHLTERDVYYTCLPYFHGISQYMVTLPALLVGAQVAMSERFSVSRFWDEIRSMEATTTFFVSTMVNALYSHAPSRRDRDNPLRAARVTPGLTAEVEMGFQERFGVKLVTGYGSTESNQFTLSPWDSPRPGSVGKVHPCYDVRIVDEEDGEVPQGQVGEMIGRGKLPFSLMLGYYKRPEDTLEVFKNLYYHTGDLGYMDADGYVYFAGRVKESIRRRGENVSAHDVESAVNLHPGVAESAAVGVPGDLGEEDIKVVVVPRDGSELRPEEVIQVCRENLPLFMVPRYVEIRSSLPRTATEKVEKHKLRAEGVTASTWDGERQK